MWNQLLTDLSEHLSESQIAKRIGTTQPTVNRLKRGMIKEPSHSQGEKILALHREVCTDTPTETDQARAAG